MIKELSNINIIINTDIDGILSGLLLVKYLNCKIIGFCNSKDTVWLDEDNDDLYGGVYVDMFVTDQRATCIDQHIIALDHDHLNSIKKNKILFSPQSDDKNNIRCFNNIDFKNKYPFGAFQYILAMLEHEGIRVDLPKLDENITNTYITVGDLLNRPDDAMKTTLCTYKRNAENWWEWLIALSNKAKSVTKLKEYLDNLSTKNNVEAEVESIKANTKNYFHEKFDCRTSDGGFKNIIEEKDGKLKMLANITKYIEEIEEITGWRHAKLPDYYKEHKGTYCRTRWLDIFYKDFVDNNQICGHKVFSYAFIYGPKNDSNTNFSFTIDMK